MIRPLRRAHLAASLALAVTMPVGVLLSVRARTPWPTDMPRLGLLEAPSTGAVDRPGIWGTFDVATRVWSGTEGSPLVELDPAVDLEHPDVLVYWDPGAMSAAGGPSPEARLIGTLAGADRRVYELPLEARSRDAQLVLYSLAHAEIVAAADFAAVGGGAGDDS